MKHAPVLAGSLLLLLVLLLLLLSAVGTLLGLRGANRWVRHTGDVRLALSRVEAMIVDAETGQRGYIVTLDARFREPYERARAAWPALLANARSLTADSADQQRRLDALEPIVREKFREMQATLEARENGVGGASLANRMLVGKETMDEIRRRIAELLSEEERLDLARQEVAADRSRMLAGLLVLASIVLVTGGGWFYGRRRLEAMDRQRLRERARAAEDLSAAQRLFQELLDNLPELAWTALPDGHVEVYNRRWFEYTGTTLEEVKGWGWEKTVDPKVLPAVVDKWKHSLASGEPFEMEFPLRRADGSFRWFLTRVRPLRDGRGEIVRWVGVNTDIHDLRTEQEYQERFVAILGHDLRNPLGAIDMAAGVLRQRAEKAKDDTTMRVLDRLGTSSRRMSRMIEQLLDLTRSRVGGGIEVRPEPMDLCSLLNEIIEEERVTHPGAQIVVDAPATLRGEWDRDRLAQVLSNLVSNALHYGSNGAAVTVKCRTTPSEVQIAVHNGGPPIAEEVQARLFDPFRRGSRESRTKYTAGLGLGLFISAQIVASHRGKIAVESSVERGTTFTVILPRAAPAVTMKRKR